MAAVSVEEPYGRLLETSLSVATWNLWGRYGPWEEREELIVAELAALGADIVALQETWVTPGGETQMERLARRLGYDHWYAAVSSLDTDGWGPALGVLSRWPVNRSMHRALRPHDGLPGWPGEVAALRLGGPRGEIPLLNVALDWPPQCSALRQASVRQVAQMAKDWGAADRFPIIVCGDFNAPPEAAELRMLTGLDTAAVPGLVLFDAWATAGDPADGAGHTWSRANRWAAPTLLPSRRIDHILVGWPAPEGGAGDVMGARLFGRGIDGGPPPSDHYGVVAELRY